MLLADLSMASDVLATFYVKNPIIAAANCRF